VSIVKMNPSRAPPSPVEAPRCRRSRRGKQGMTLTLGHFLSLGAMLFALSVIGIFLNRKNLIVLLMAIELMLLAVNMNFVAFSYYLGDMARPGLRVLHPDRGGGRVGHRPGHPGAAVPQQVQHQRRRTQLRSRAEINMSRNPFRIRPAGRAAGTPGRRHVGRPVRHEVRRQLDRPRLSHTLTILGVLVAFIISAMTLKSVASTARASTPRSTNG
jgi:hypothetical protein